MKPAVLFVACTESITCCLLVSSDFFEYAKDDEDVEEMEEAFDVLMLCWDELELDDLEELADEDDFLPLLERSCFLPKLNFCSTKDDDSSALDRLSISK